MIEFDSNLLGIIKSSYSLNDYFSDNIGTKIGTFNYSMESIQYSPTSRAACKLIF